MKKDFERLDSLLKKIDVPDAYKHIGSVHLIKKARQSSRLC